MGARAPARAAAARAAEGRRNDAVLDAMSDRYGGMVQDVARASEAPRPLGLRRLSAAVVVDAKYEVPLARLTEAGANAAVFAGSAQLLESGVGPLAARDLLIVEVRDRATDIPRLQMLQAGQPGLVIVAAVAGLDVPLARTLMHAGVSDVVSLPFDADELAASVKRAGERIAERTQVARAGKLVSVFGSVGGVGSTTIATQTACLLASAGKAAGRQACLIDLDIQTGSAAIQLDMQPSLTMGDLLAVGSRLDGALVRSIVKAHATGLNLIAAPPVLLPLEAISGDVVLNAMGLALREFDVIIADLPCAWTNWAVQLLAGSNLSILVTELSVPAIRQARRRLDLLKAQGLGDLEMLVVANRHARGWFTTVSLEEIERALGRKFDAVISNDYRNVSAAIDQGRPLSEIAPKARVVKDLNGLAGTIEARLAQIGE